MIQPDPKTATSVSPERFLDTLPLILGYPAYISWLEETGQEKGPLVKQGFTLVKRMMKPYSQGLDAFIKPLVHIPQNRALLGPAFNRASRGGPLGVRLKDRARFIKVLFRWFQKHPKEFNEAFPRSVAIGRKIMFASRLEGPDLLNALAALPSASGITEVRTWLKKAAAQAGEPVSSTENAEANLETQANVLKRIEAIPGWQTTPELMRLHQQVAAGHELSPVDLAFLDSQAKGARMASHRVASRWASPRSKFNVGDKVESYTGDFKGVRTVDRVTYLNDRTGWLVLIKGVRNWTPQDELVPAGLVWG